MADIETLCARVNERFAGMVQSCFVHYHEVTVTTAKADVHELCILLRDEPGFEFKQLTDVTVVDYVQYGHVEWETNSATDSGFDRGVASPKPSRQGEYDERGRFAVVYHLLSITQNQRLRLKVFLSEDSLAIPSVTDVWSSANWFEREAYDLFGVKFEGHPDMRRILTDYGFEGHPFRKDFPLSGYVEVRYDAASQKVIYEPVEIEPRTLVPRVKREEKPLNVDEKGTQHA